MASTDNIVTRTSSAGNPSHHTPVKRGCYKTFELILGILFGIWNNLSTVVNAKLLCEKGHDFFGFLTIFFLLFPGTKKNKLLILPF